MSIKRAVVGSSNRIGFFFRPNLPIQLSRKRYHHHTYTNVPFSQLQNSLFLHHRLVVCSSQSPLLHGYLSRRGSIRTITHYERLGITPPSNEKEIKLAYFKRAKECHPDLHGDDKKLEFQELSQSYQVLSDPSKKTDYDRFGNEDVDRGHYDRKTRGGMSPPMEQKEASEVFYSVFRELGVLQYLEDLEFDVKSAYDKARTTGDYQPFWNLMKERKGLVLGFLIPSVVILRSPWLAMAFFRGAMTFGVTIAQLLIKNEQIRFFILTYIWKQMQRAYKKASTPSSSPYDKSRKEGRFSGGKYKSRRNRRY